MAVTPDVVARLRKAGLDVMIETGAGRGACFPDEAYVAAGARVGARSDVYADADILAVIHRPDCARLRAGQIVIGLLRPDEAPEELTGVTALSFEGLPRTLSRAQSMDVLTSQTNIAGYKAAVLAADTFGGFFPMMMTAAGTVRPAKVLVLGGGSSRAAGDGYGAAPGRDRHRVRRPRGGAGRHRVDRRPASIAFFADAGLDYVSCSPYRLPIARLEAGRAAVPPTSTESDTR